MFMIQNYKPHEKTSHCEQWQQKQQQMAEYSLQDLMNYSDWLWEIIKEIKRRSEKKITEQSWKGKKRNKDSTMGMRTC